MVERVLCKHEVVGSIPSDSTMSPVEAGAASDRGIHKFPSRLCRGGKSDIVN